MAEVQAQLSPQRLEALLREGMSAVLRQEEERMQAEDGMGSDSGINTEQPLRVIRALKEKEHELEALVRTSVRPGRTQAALLAAVATAARPYKGAIRTYLLALYEADKALSESLGQAKEQLGSMKQALDRPVSVDELVRYGHTVRTVTSAPKEWDARITWMAPKPFMPVNECIAASELRKHQLEVQIAQRERRMRRRVVEPREAAPAPTEGGPANEGVGVEEEKTTEPPQAAEPLHAPAVAEGVVGGDLEGMMDIEVPADWQPGQEIKIDATVLERLRSDTQKAVKKEKEADVEQAEKKRKALEEEERKPDVRPLPTPAPPILEQPHAVVVEARPVAKKPKKQTFMEESEDEDEEDDEQDAE